MKITAVTWSTPMCTYSKSDITQGFDKHSPSLLTLEGTMVSLSAVKLLPSLDDSAFSNAVSGTYASLYYSDGGTASEPACPMPTATVFVSAYFLYFFTV